MCEVCDDVQSAIRNPQSAIRNPQSAIRNPQSAIRNRQFLIRNWFLGWLLTWLATATPSWATVINIPIDLNNFKTLNPVCQLELTSEGIKVFNCGYRTGLSIFAKATYNLVGAEVFIKFKPFGDGQYSGFGLAVLDAANTRYLIPNDRSFPFGTTNHSYNGSVVINDGTWYFGRFKVNTDKTFESTLSTENYDLNGGTPIQQVTGTIADTDWNDFQNASLGFAGGDNYSAAAYAVLGELKINSPTPNFTLTIAKSGNGTITSSPAGINCGATCATSFAQATAVTLTATPTAGNTFGSWSGDADCSDGKVTMNAAKTCTATFNVAVTVPIATTNAATAVTANGATLNGQVNSNGATAIVTFDFGPTTTYGTSINAVPNSLYGTTTVTAAKTGLTCGTTYHYRVKAVSNKGTGYGADKTFITTSCTISRRDLIITALTLTPGTPTAANGTFNLAVTVKNQGIVSSNGGFLDVWANRTTAAVCGADGDKWVEVGTVAAGASKVLTVSSVPAGVAGAKTLRAFVDSWCEVVESNEANNQMIKAYTVQ